MAEPSKKTGSETTAGNRDLLDEVQRLISALEAHPDGEVSAQVTALLDSTGAQSTIMDLVSRFSGVFFDGGAFEVRDRGDAPLSPDAATMLVICAMSVRACSKKPSSFSTSISRSR